MPAEFQQGPVGKRASDFILRAWEPDDAEGLCALANMENFRSGTLRLPYESLQAWRQKVSQQPAGGLSLLAETGGIIVGSASLVRMAGRRNHSGEIGMGVHDGFQGRGIGSALLAALLESADQWLGIRRVQLTVYADNDRAIAMYRKFGFEVEGRFRQYAFREGVLVDALSMARLSSGPASGAAARGE